MNTLNAALALLPGLAVVWVIACSNWLNSPRCLANAWHLLRGFADKVSYGSYWEPYSLCVDPYWVNQWIKNYAAGLVKRGLLGHLLAGVGDGRINLIYLNAIGIILCVSLAYLIAVRLYLLLGSRNSALVFVWVALLWMTPFGKSFAETLADPLQVAAVLWLSLSLLLWFFGRYFDGREWLVDLLVSLSYIVSILIHEGAFLLAAVPFFFLGKRSWIWYGFVVAAALLVARLSGSEGLGVESKIAEALTAYNPLNGLEMAYRSGGAIASQVSFVDNFRMESAKYIVFPLQSASDFATFLAFAFVLGAAFRAFCLGVLARGCDAESACRIRCSLNTALVSFACSVLVSLPFFYVTHDWTRYICVLFALSIAVLPARVLSHVEFPLSDKPLMNRGFDWFARLGRMQPIAVLPDRYALSYSFVVLCLLALLMPHSIDLRTSLPVPYRYVLWLLAVTVALVSVGPQRSLSSRH